MESTGIITYAYTVLELGPFKYLMEETGFPERNCYLKCLNRGAGGGENAAHPRAIEPCTLA